MTATTTPARDHHGPEAVKRAVKSAWPVLDAVFRNRQIVPVQRDHPPARAVLIRVYWPDGLHTDYPVIEEPER